jgi:hypothetical protein
MQKIRTPAAKDIVQANHLVVEIEETDISTVNNILGVDPGTSRAARPTTELAKRYVTRNENRFKTEVTYQPRIE